MVRPKKNGKERRSRHVIFRLTEAEYERLNQNAEKAGLSPNELSRRLTQKGQKRLIVKTYHRYDPAFLKRVDQIGHNLNQLVKNAHIFGRVSPRLEFVCESINYIINQAIEEINDDTQDS